MFSERKNSINLKAHELTDFYLDADDNPISGSNENGLN